MTEPSFSASWTPASVDEDLRRWTTFLADQRVTWSPSAQDRDFVDQLMRTGGERAGELIELRLGKIANDQLKAAGDARRVVKEVGPSTRAWYVLTPEQRSELEKTGRRFDAGLEAPLRQLATIPVTLGAYFLAQYVCTSMGIDRNIAWVIALVAYVITVRVVRGRWPLQRS